MALWSRWRKALATAAFAGLALQGAPCIAQTSADGPCSSLRGAVAQLAARTAGTEFTGSYTVFDALLQELGFDEEFVLSLNATAVLIPSDAAFAEFFAKFPEADEDAMMYVKLNADAFKQIILFHFSVSELPGISGKAKTALQALPRLHEDGFINVHAICGRVNSREVEIEYTRDGSSITFSEPLGQNFNTEAVTICDNYPQAIVYSLETVLHPCPNKLIFPYPREGCATISDVIPERPFQQLIAKQTDGIVRHFNNPNRFVKAGNHDDDRGYTLFIPTQAALERAGVTNPAFLEVQDAFEHVLNGHMVRGTVCLGGAAAEIGTPRSLRTLLTDAFCNPLDTIEVLQGGAEPSSTLLRTSTGSVANTTTRVNLRVCGGIVHEIDDVLLPCSMDEYLRPRVSQLPLPPAVQMEEAGAVRAGVATALAVLAAASALALL
eukprot:jgi/Ulvmu1/6885/UM031_0091.1